MTRIVSRINIPGLNQAIPILVVLMELLWAYAWLIWISGWDTWGWEGTPLNIFSCILLVVFTEVVSRVSLNRDWSLKRVRLMVLPSSILLLLILVRWNLGGGYSLWDAGWLAFAGEHIGATVIALIFGVYLVWRGIAGSVPRFYFSDLYRKFIIGMVALVLLLVIWGFTAGRDTIWSSAGGFIISFFGSGLLGLGIVNLQALRAGLLQHKEDISAFRRRRVTMMIALGLAILGIAVAVASAFSNNIWGSIVHGLGRLLDWILIALGYIFIPFGYILEALIYAGRWLIRLITGGDQPIKFNLMDMSDLQKMAEGQAPLSMPPAVFMAIKWGLLAVIIGLLVFFLARMLIRYWEGKTPKDIEEIHETVFSWKVVKFDLRMLFAWLFRWMRRSKKAAAAGMYQPPRPSLDGENGQGADYNVRELYQALLWEGRRMGTARRPAETPYEYRKRLAERIDRAAGEIDVLTEAYIIERYGQVDLPSDKVSFLNRVWRKLKARILNRDAEP